MKSLRSFFLSMLVALGLAAGLARDTCAQSLFTPYCPAATITSTRAAAASIFNLSKIRSYTALSASYNVLSGSNFNLVAMVAHRGVWEFCPENTLEAYEAALDLGAEAVEMDIRPSAPGYNSNEGVNYPNGEMFLTHDYDLRGESPDLDNINPQNVIYTATPDSLTGRAMVDRNGRPAYANNCVPVPVPVTSNCTATTPIVFRSLTALLTHILLKARANPATIVTGGGNQGRDLVTRGAEVMLDVKGGDRGLVFDPATPDLVCPTNPAIKYCNSTTYIGVAEAMAEVSAFEIANHVDLTQMIVYKFVYKNMTSAQWTALVNTYYSGQSNLPGMVLIAYNQPNAQTPIEIYPSSATDGQGYQSYAGYLLTNWNVQFEGVSTWHWNNADLLALSPATGYHGTESFKSTDGFPEGTRFSGAGCCYVPQAVQAWGQATFEFSYQPPSSPLRPFSGWPYNVISTSFTVDSYPNANRYLINRGLRFTSQLQ